MSLIKRFAQEQEEIDNRNEALKALLECDLFAVVKKFRTQQ
ncbi:hypothetical protein [Pseudoduganella violacea]|uniref:Uncharacterized protein n=1 Tax=Pseudoduganella violacea TaxID=1715466 RepID=A0A7W5BGE4_9BURK|nr:hypothetical protein [Pseudoduganella violacea]MBB3122508.1 hypothetical protein [Pseudoduganella violacea]